MPFRVHVLDSVLDATYMASVDADRRFTVETIPEGIPDSELESRQCDPEMSVRGGNYTMMWRPVATMNCH